MTNNDKIYNLANSTYYMHNKIENDHFFVALLHRSSCFFYVYYKQELWFIKKDNLYPTSLSFYLKVTTSKYTTKYLKYHEGSPIMGTTKVTTAYIQFHEVQKRNKQRKAKLARGSSPDRAHNTLPQKPEFIGIFVNSNP